MGSVRGGIGGIVRNSETNFPLQQPMEYAIVSNNYPHLWRTAHENISPKHKD